MFFKKDVKNFVNNNVITSHIVGNGGTIINEINGSRIVNTVINKVSGNKIVNTVNSGSKEVAKKYELSKEYLHLSIKETVLKPDIVFRAGTEKLFLPVYADKKEYREVLTNILVSCAWVLFLIASVFAVYLTDKVFPVLLVAAVFTIAFSLYVCIFGEMDIRSVEFYETKHFYKKDFLLVKEFCPEEETLWTQAIKQAIFDDNDAAEKYARNVLTLASKRKKVVQKKESSKWEELSTQKEIQAGFEEDIV